MSEWQPIETAPRNGVGVLVWVGIWEMLSVAWFTEGQWWARKGRTGRMPIPKPTRWVPLREPPTEDTTHD